MAATHNNSTARWITALVAVIVASAGITATASGLAYTAGLNKGAIEQSKLSLAILEKRFDVVEREVQEIKMLQQRVLQQVGSVGSIP